MASLAALAREAGHTVSGSDVRFWSPMGPQLRAMGLDLVEGYGEDDIPDADLYVVGNAMTRGMPVIERLLREGRRMVSGPSFLRETLLAPDRTIVAVAGTHGKTTTTAMLSWVLTCAGLAPGYLIGGVPNFSHSSAQLGAGPFVVEGDEYDCAFFDKRAKVVVYRPHHMIVLNLEFDHADIYRSLSDIETQMHHAVRTVPDTGSISAASTDSIQRVIQRECWAGVRWISGDPLSLWGWARDRGTLKLQTPEGMRETPWPHAGDYMAHNAACAVSCAHALGVDPMVALKACASFNGVARRSQARANGDVSVYEDFAHHPTEIASTLSAFRERYPDSRVVVALGLHTNSMSSGAHAPLVKESVSSADEVYIHASSLAGEGVMAVDVDHRFTDQAALGRSVADRTQRGDIVIGMSNKDFSPFFDSLERALRSRQLIEEKSV